MPRILTALLFLLSIAVLPGWSCTARELGDAADAADGAAAVAVWFGPGGIIASAALIVLGTVARAMEKRALDRKVTTARAEALTLKEQLQKYTQAETMKAFPETDKYHPTESEILARVKNGEHDLKCNPGLKEPDAPR